MLKSVVCFSILKLCESIPRVLNERPTIDPEPIYYPLDPIPDDQFYHIGGNDNNGCCVSCGYQYCPELETCVRVWETFCKSLTISSGH